MAEKQCNSSSCTKESCEGCPSKNKPTSFQVASNAEKVVSENLW